MERRDYLERQIDQLGKALGKLFADLIGLKKQGKAFEGIEITNDVLESELDLDIDTLLYEPGEFFISKLVDDKQMSNESLDSLADILIFLSDETDPKNKERIRRLNERALLILLYLKERDTTYSFDRHYKIEKLQNI